MSQDFERLSWRLTGHHAHLIQKAFGRIELDPVVSVLDDESEQTICTLYEDTSYKQLTIFNGGAGPTVVSDYDRSNDLLTKLTLWSNGRISLTASKGKGDVQYMDLLDPEGARDRINRIVATVGPLADCDIA